MKKPFFLNRLLVLVLLSGSCLFSFGQSAANPAPSKVYHRWHSISPRVQMPSTAAGDYRSLPETDYTPSQDIAEWGAKKEVEAFAAKLNVRLSALYILSVDETGYVRKIKTIKTNDAGSAEAFSALLLNTKISGPSFLHNQAVASYVPCSISITNHQITIL